MNRIFLLLAVLAIAGCAPVPSDQPAGTAAVAPPAPRQYTTGSRLPQAPGTADPSVKVIGRDVMDQGRTDSINSMLQTGGTPH